MSKKHNTIFGTTEKSNFILNMKMSTTYKIERILLVISVALMILGGAVWLFSGQSSNYIGMAFLACGAFATGLWYAISVWKTRTPILKNKSFFLIMGLALIATLSTLDSWSKVQSLYGNSGRFEGIIALISYFLLFLGATIIYEKKSINLILDTIVITGVLNAIIALLQKTGLVYTPFQFLFSTAEENVFLPSGLVGSPIFLATLLVLINSVALFGTLFDENKKRNILYGFAVVLFVVVAPLTNSLVAFIGMPLSFIAVLIFAIFRKEKSAIIRCIIYMIMTAISFVTLTLTGVVGIKDLSIAFQDGYYFLFISGPYSSRNADGAGLYQMGFEIAKKILGDFSMDTHYWLLGTGPDCLGFPQFITEKYFDLTVIPNSLDKIYNQYLNLACSQGIFALIGYVAVIALSLKKGLSKIRTFFKENNWHTAALTISVIVYAVVTMFSVSTIYVAPFFWIMAGLLNADFHDADKVEPRK
ncbi:MAG: hypothetical protein J6J52_05065 [Oscillospiraceae bacterium]|nr:hypothetical protein [Oscillospiraceae bacterium]